MLKDEFDQLLTLFNDGAEGKLSNLEEVFSRSLEFFQHLQKQIQSGSSEERQEAIKMMGDLYTRMMQATKQITEKSGLSEDQLLSYAENPSNFTPDQWKAIQESRQKIATAGHDLAKTIAGQGASPSQGEKAGKPPHGATKSKKSQWMKS